MGVKSLKNGFWTVGVAVALGLGLSSLSAANSDGYEQARMKERLPGKDHTLVMLGIQYYMHERCVHIDAGRTVSYRYRAEFPVDFDIHFHGEGPLGFKAQEKNTAQINGQFTSDKARNYCFTWSNPADLAVDEFDLVWSYQLDDN